MSDPYLLPENVGPITSDPIDPAIEPEETDRKSDEYPDTDDPELDDSGLP